MNDPVDRTVTLIYKSLPHYRAPLYEGIRERLDGERIQFRLIYGQPSPDEVRKQDTVDISWAHAISNKTITLGSRTLYWQPCLRLARGSELVIVEQASKLLTNYVLFGKQLLGGTKLAFWGHGRNFQDASASQSGEVVKRYMSRHVHWWFAYNDKSAGVVRSLGFPEERITVVQNTIDTAPLITQKERTSPQELSDLKRSLGLQGDNVGVFIGGLYEDKRLDFLIEAASEIRKRVPDFELLVIGGGPQEHMIEAAAQANPWIRWVGPKFGMEKVPYLMLARVMVLPAWVGLVVIDSFALEIPLVAVDAEAHPPEVDYLVDRVNGLRLPRGSTVTQYAASVAGLLQDDALHENLVAGCRESAKRYTMGEMIDRFTRGILAAVGSTRSVTR